jgi:hypothetical protein
MAECQVPLAFVDVGKIGGKHVVYIIELHVKLRPKRIKIVEMRAKYF